MGEGGPYRHGPEPPPIRPRWRQYLAELGRRLDRATRGFWPFN